MSNQKYRWQNKNPEWSDERLITAYISTENASYVGELFCRYSDMIFGLCLKHLKNVQESEDASYELFELMISKLKTQQIMIFKPWLYRTSTNFCIDKLRKSKTNIIISLDDRFETARDSLDISADFSEREALLARIDHCLKQLNDDQKVCIDLFYFQEKSYQDIAQQLNISWSTTRSYIQNGKRNLKICMEKHGN
ncbi:MAG: sigma-70 family RNA polymerase sigma factor [Saprospiraceae bacterium]|jgi:RNA polymerase sigma-70 factor (ECF subfamily)|nr:sigma-70 family RNA polymerase sigma factor [Saprospiraceae bacterium]MBK9564794.1 sigma-70 family RNA polymerase sigma factor [Saprospiraceae bacterium]MBP6447160.1 sigma-70 family RNA polymerase sigma factor [Saprospiraceae bacterium]